MQEGDKLTWRPEDREYAKWIFANFKRSNGLVDWKEAERVEGEKLASIYAIYSKKKFQCMGSYMNRTKEHIAGLRAKLKKRKKVDPVTGATVSYIKRKYKRREVEQSAEPVQTPTSVHVKHCPECGFNLVPIQRALSTLARLNG